MPDTNGKDQAYISAPTLNATRTGGATAAFAAVVGAVAGVVKQLGAESSADAIVAVGAFGVVAAALVAGAVLLANDVRTRGLVKAAELGRSEASRESTPQPWVSTPASGWTVRIAGGGSEVFGVLAVRTTGSDATLLVVRRGLPPRWVPLTDVLETVDVPGWR